MNYLKHFWQALLYSGIFFVIGLLLFWGLDFYILLLSALLFLFSIIHDAGRDYVKLTRQSMTNRYIFNVIVNPPYVFVCVVSILYIVNGRMYWFSWALAGIVTVSVYAAWFTQWRLERNKRDD